MGHSLAWDGDHLVINDESDLARIDKPYLSPSSASGLEGCVARWVADQVLPSKHDPFSPAELGTSAHSVLEDLYGLPADQRTRHAARRLLDELAITGTPWLPEPPDNALDAASFLTPHPPRGSQVDLSRRTWMAQVWRRVRGVFAVEDPTKVMVRAREWTLDGVEVAGVPFKGFIDRADVAGDETTVGTGIVDYKSGKVTWAGAKWGDHHGDQLRLYAAAVKVVDGRLPLHARVLYTAHGKQRYVSLGRDEMNDTLRRFAESWEALNVYRHSATVPTKTGSLCGWCPLVTSCPAAAAEGKTARVPLPHVEVPVLVPVQDLIAVGFGSTSPASGTSSGLTDEDDWLDTTSPIDTTSPAWPDAEFADTEMAAPTELTGTGDAEDGLAGHDLADLTVIGLIGHTGSHDAPISGLRSDADHIHGASHNQSVRGDDMLIEDKPWVPTTGDSSLNPASYTAIAVFGFTEMAVSELHRAGVQMTPATVRALAGTFALVVENVQVQLTGSTSMQDGANTRLRGALRCTLDTIPLPFGGTHDEWAEWVARATRRVEGIVKVALDIYEQGTGDEPWADLAVAPDPDDEAEAAVEAA